MHEEKQMKQMLLEMFKWYHNFCDENNLRYYAVGGTMLGAVRHGGFIPWDDDIDVGMPRKDYEKFLELTKNKDFEKKYRVEYPNDENKEYTYLCAKVYHTETTLTEEIKYPIKRGIYLDIFPLDGAGNSNEEKNKVYKKIKNQVILHQMCNCKLKKDRKWYKNLSVIFGNIISVFVSERHISNKITLLSKQNDFDKSKYVANFVGRWWDREIMPCEFFGKPTLYQFEDTKMYGVENSDQYLKSLYGDYMKLPPEEKRIAVHDYISRDLNKSYLD